MSSYYHIRVLILLYTCPHTTIYVSSYSTIYVSSCIQKKHSSSGQEEEDTYTLFSYYYIRVLILLYTCPHTTMYVSSYSTIYMFPHIFRKRIAGAGRRRRRPSSRVATTTREKRRQRVRGALLSLSPTSIYNRLRQRTELI